MVAISFEVDWFNPLSNLVEKMYLRFYTENNTIEILTDTSTFLKRIHYPELTISDLFLGNTITIHRRLYTLVNYANTGTRDYFSKHEIRFLVILPAENLRLLGKVSEVAKKYRMGLGRVITISNEVNVADAFAHPQDTIIEIVGILENNIETIHQHILKFSGRGATVVNLTAASAQEVFQQAKGVQIDFDATLCLLKPHILREQKVGEVVQAILDAGFTIGGLFSVQLSVPMAEELFNAYRGVVENFSTVIEVLCSGPVVAIAVTSSEANYEYDLVSAFRELAGPNSSELAQAIRPQTLRARFGKNNLYNALHCTDLPEDGLMECRYFFETLANL